MKVRRNFKTFKQKELANVEKIRQEELHFAVAQHLLPVQQPVANLLCVRCEKLVFKLQYEWRRLWMIVTETKVERAENPLESNVLLQIDGTTPFCENIRVQV